MKITRITNNQGYMTKCISIGADGKLVKQPAANLYDGVAEIITISNLKELGSVITSLKSNQALTYGVTAHESINLITKGKADGIYTVARCRDHFRWPDGAGVLMGDVDPKPGTTLSADEAQNALLKAVPELRGCERLWTASASSGIKSADGTINTGIAGQRFYFRVADASMIPAYGDIIVKRLWLAGHGFIFINKAGGMQPRTMVDATVWQPERLDFAAAPVLGEGLSRVVVEHEYVAGGAS